MHPLRMSWKLQVRHVPLANNALGYLILIKSEYIEIVVKWREKLKF